ncbi:thiamine-phosphate kinase [Acidocella sp.]|jgi:thiamine-monophosphate kinase|uniref:thiamine-phosphate kinase n=1 Tax=Acidocella sp. TaxID=50710 RepID=UPI002F42B4A1
MSAEVILRDLGERRILREIIPKYVSAAGDDCANLGRLKGHIVVTTDPAPPPAARIIGGDHDLYWVGWLLVTINASDIAASGAVPHALVAALEMPPTLPIRDLHRLLEGIRDSCAANGLEYVGGNLREANSVAGIGTAIGVSERSPLSRRGAKPGDRLLVIGEGGRFWADAERIRLGLTVDRTSSPIFAPVSQAKIVHRLHSEGLLRCAMDTSDGLAPTLVELAGVNQLGLCIWLDTMATSHGGLCERPERFWMGWGDWTVVAAVEPDRIEAILTLLNRLGTPATVIGEFVECRKGVFLSSGSSEVPLERLESERFAVDSWFDKGIDEYRRLLNTFPLPSNQPKSSAFS